MTTSRSRSWCFTLNNYTEADQQFLQSVPAAYLCYGQEIAPSTGTPHLQGYMYLKEAKTLQAMKTMMGQRYHLEVRKGTTKQAIDYCKKDGLFTEFGKITIRDAKDDSWTDVIRLAESGDMTTLKEEYPRIFLTHFKTIMSIRAFNSTPLDGALQHEWWYGPTGTGKSRKAWTDYPNHYSKAVNKWWDGYYGEDVVVIEEWEPKNEMTAAKLKIWADRYPFPAEIKGGTLTKVRPTKIIVTSNYTIDECFPNAQDNGPLKRRFKVVHFPPGIFNIPLPEPTYEIPEPTLGDNLDGLDINNIIWEL